jgi:hypothetical protein
MNRALCHCCCYENTLMLALCVSRSIMSLPHAVNTSVCARAQHCGMLAATASVSKADSQCSFPVCSLLARLLKQGRHTRLETEAQQQARAGVQPDAAASLLSVSLGCELLQAVPGRLTVQVDARLAHNAQVRGVPQVLYDARCYYILVMSDLHSMQ